MAEIHIKQAEFDMILRVRQLGNGTMDVIIRTEKEHQGEEQYKSLASYWAERLLKKESRTE